LVFACRDAADRERRGCQKLPPQMLVLERDHVARVGAGASASQAAAFLTRAGGPTDGFWINLDADTFHQTITQAVDDPRPEGLTWDEGQSALGTAIASSQAAGLQVAIYTDFDNDGSNGRGLAETVRNALAS
jgi:arginase family enzyme